MYKNIEPKLKKSDKNRYEKRNTNCNCKPNPNLNL